MWNFGTDLEDMKDHLETISAVLVDAERQTVKEELVRLWLKRLKHAAIDISDKLEDYQDTTNEANAKMPGVLSYLPLSYKKITIANRMKSLREKLRKIRNEINSFSFKMGTATTNDQAYDERETTSYLPQEPVIGRDREKQEIINLLSPNTCNNEIVIVPIYGLGGMGKSTLAQLVYNDSQFKQYHHRLWVYVSQDFNLNKIGRSIISQLQPQGGQQNLGTQQVINQCLESLLCGKKVLVVLDDLWEERMAELDKLRMMLHIKESKVDVIVTTRKEEIARKLCTSEPYKLQTLEDDKCWEIIKRYSKFEHKSNSEKMCEIGLDIAKKCGGVALAAQAVGFMLQSIDDLTGWEEINNSDIWNGSSEDCDVLPSLKLSYERMPPQLRICFSYCAIFPKGHNIVEDDLVQQWVALGFIVQSKGKDYINKLLGMSFLQISKLPSTSRGHVARYTMHDLVHDLARLTMADELIVFDVAPKRNTHVHKYCRYALLSKYDRTIKLENMPSKVRALRFTDSSEVLDIRSGAFVFAKCLRTLDFSGCSSILLPESIGRLKQLRCLIAPRMQNENLPECITEVSKLQYLNISGSSRITELPKSIGYLGCLQYLSLSGGSNISKLPESFGNLKCMVHLDMSDCSWLRELPESFSGLTQLQYLNLSCCACLEWLPDGIGNLVGLQHLYMSDCKQIRELPKSLLKLQSLSHLNLSGCSSMRRGSLSCLRGLTALQHLVISHMRDRYLENTLKDFIATLTNLPKSIGNLKSLRTLDISYCYALKSLPESIGRLGLKSLVVEGCPDVLQRQASSLVSCSQTLPSFIVCADEAKGCSNLHQLEGIHVSELGIYFLENVMSLEEANEVKLSDKHNLSILRLSWSSVRAVQNLEDKDLLGQLVPPTCLKSIGLQGYSSTSFPGWLMCINSHLTNLVSVDLHDMPKCSNLPPLGQLPHLETLVLYIMPGIKRIDREFCGGKGAFRRLSYFSIEVMESLEEWSTTYSVEDGVEEFMFPVLDHLEIRRCPRLRLKPCPPTFRECHIVWSDQVLSSLEEVHITNPHCSSPSRATKLVLLNIKDDSGQSIRLFHHFPALRELTISGRHLRSVPESMRQLASLESLKLSECDLISALPEWLGDLSSLKSLVIERCDGIESLPACIQQFTKQHKLVIRNSQKLKKWCESEENKTKLHHINVRLFE